MSSPPPTPKNIQKILKKLGLLAPDGSLKQLDSLTLIELVAQLEKKFNLRIPPETITHDAFRSVESIVGFVETVNATDT